MSTTIVTRVAPALSCEELSIRSDKRTVVSAFSWSHSPPGIVWVTGSNGSGKSSLLQVFAGWRKPAAGRVRWGESASRQLRHLAPAMHAPPALQVGQFVSFVQQHALTASPLVDELYPRAVSDSAPFGKLSTGEAKRLLLWALLRHGDGPLLLDEPYEHLARDAKTALTAILQERAMRKLVMVATNQDVPAGQVDLTLHVDAAAIEIAYGR